MNDYTKSEREKKDEVKIVNIYQSDPKAAAGIMMQYAAKWRNYPLFKMLEEEALGRKPTLH